MQKASLRKRKIAKSIAQWKVRRRGKQAMKEIPAKIWTLGPTISSGIKHKNPNTLKMAISNIRIIILGFKELRRMHLERGELEEAETTKELIGEFHRKIETLTAKIKIMENEKQNKK